MNYHVYASTDVGCVRDLNEDAFLIDRELGLFVVCDGLGGHAAGEVASEMACRAIQRHIGEHPELLAAARGERDAIPARDAAMELAAAAVDQANAEIRAEAASKPDLHRMGCTLVMLILLGDSAVIAHAGDSRAYLLRDGELLQLTEDHSWVDEQLKRGMITPEQARRCRHQSVVTRAVGTQPRVDADVLFLDLLERDTFLLCSDGLTRYLERMDLALYLPDAEDDEEHRAVLPDRLIEMAKERGGHDNITALTLHLTDGDRERDERVRGKIEVIGDIPLFSDLKPVEVIKLLSISRERGYAPDERVIHQGDLDRRLMICIEGAVEVRKSSQAISQLGKRDFFGEMSLIDQFPRSADVVALMPSRMIEIEREGFLRLIDREPHLGVKILWEICRGLNKRLRNTSDDLVWSRLVGPPSDQTLTDDGTS